MNFCISRVRVAVKKAAAIDEEFARAVAVAKGNAVSVVMMPPLFPKGALLFEVRPSERTGAQEWSCSSEVLGGYHRLCTRGGANLSFDSRSSELVARLEPLFRAAADDCLKSR